MSLYARSVPAGALAALLGLVVGGALLSFYVEWVWFSDSDTHYKVLTSVLFGAWLAVPVFTGYILARRSGANLLATALIAVVLLAPAGWVGVRVVSHNNLCFAGSAYPLDESVLFGRECGR